MRFILDRIETDISGKKIAVFECDDKMIDISQDQMPKGFIDEIFDGVIIEAEYKDENLISPVILYEETEERKKKIDERFKRIFKRRNG